MRTTPENNPKNVFRNGFAFVRKLGNFFFLLLWYLDDIKVPQLNTARACIAYPWIIMIEKFSCFILMANVCRFSFYATRTCEVIFQSYMFYTFFSSSFLTFSFEVCKQFDVPFHFIFMIKKSSISLLCTLFQCLIINK